MANKCCKRVYAGTFSGHPCKLPGTVQVGEKWYCKRHDPKAVQARRDKRSAEMMADIRQRMDAAENTKKKAIEDERDASYWRHAVATNMIRDGADGVALIKSEVDAKK